MGWLLKYIVKENKIQGARHCGHACNPSYSGSRDLEVRGQPGQKAHKTPCQPIKAGHRGVHLSSYRCKALSSNPSIAKKMTVQDVSIPCVVRTWKLPRPCMYMCDYVWMDSQSPRNAAFLWFGDLWLLSLTTPIQPFTVFLLLLD
jgi:hypothetical protein